MPNQCRATINDDIDFKIAKVRLEFNNIQAMDGMIEGYKQLKQSDHRPHKKQQYEQWITAFSAVVAEIKLKEIVLGEQDE